MTHDPMWMRAFLGVHIVAGAMSFLLAPVALATAKGGRQHRRWGKVYLYAMGVVAATALPMALYRPVLFLALVSVFSFYAAWSAYRVLKLKDLARGGRAGAIDWAAGALTFAASFALAALGILRPVAVQRMGVVSVVFGVIGMRLAYGQMRTFVRRPQRKLFWMDTHIGNFIGSYIAAWSAFSAVTLSRVLGNTWYVWLWPTIVGVPALILTISYYNKKYGTRPVGVVAV